MSVDFDPVRLDPKRGRVDPVVIGAVVVILALAVAILKPWDDGADPTSVADASIAPSVTADPPVPTIAASPVPTPPRVAVPPLSWTDVASVVEPHDAWGVRGILAVDSPVVSARPAAFADRWTPAALDQRGRASAVIDPDGRSVVMLGVTAPPGTDAIDARVWRIHQDDQLEWVDTVQVDPNLTHVAFLFSRPGDGGEPYADWLQGSYRIDVLTVAGIRRIEVRVPDRSGHVPRPDALPAAAPGVETAAGADTSQIRGGLFATTDVSAVPLIASGHRLLTANEAWLDVAGSRDSVVATAYLPRATGLGVMLASGDDITSSRIRRLTPGGPFQPSRPINGMSDRQGRDLYVLFPAPDGVWPPGTYAITLEWINDRGQHQGTWHVELRPGLS